MPVEMSVKKTQVGQGTECALGAVLGVWPRRLLQGVMFAET